MPITQQIVPLVNMTGTFTVNLPFNNVVNPSTIYEVVAIESIAAIIAQGRDPVAEVYTPVNLPASSMQSDLINNVVIVSLQDPSGTVIKVPASYFTGMPQSVGVLYTNLMIGITLSALPDTLSITNLLSEIADLVSGSIGITTQPTVVKYGQSVYLSEAEDIAAEAARARAIVTGNSLTNQLAVATGTITNLTAQIATLQTYILSLQTAGTIAVPVTQTTPTAITAAQTAAAAAIALAATQAAAASAAANTTAPLLQNTLATNGYAIQFNNTSGVQVMLCTTDGLAIEDTYLPVTNVPSTSVVSTNTPQGAYYIFDSLVQAQAAWQDIVAGVASSVPEVTIIGSMNGVLFTNTLPISTALIADVGVANNAPTYPEVIIVPNGNVFALTLHNASLQGAESYLSISTNGNEIDSGAAITSFAGKLTTSIINNGISPIGQTVLFDTKAQAQAAILLITNAYANNQNQAIITGTIMGVRFTGSYLFTPELITDLGNVNTLKNPNALYGNSFTAVPVVLD